MTNEQILKKAIEKAIKNGMPTRGFNVMEMTNRWTEFIWTHDFAKAFWGEEKIGTGLFESYVENHKLKYRAFKDKAWCQHLVLMVLEEDPIKYLEKFI